MGSSKTPFVYIGRGAIMNPSNEQPFFPPKKNMARTAVIVGNHRLLLAEGSGPPAVGIIMQHPSAADKTSDLCFREFRKLGFKTIKILNVFSRIASSLEEMNEDPVIPANYETIRKELTTVDVVVAAWGHSIPHKWLAPVSLLLKDYDVYCLAGSINHPPFALKTYRERDKRREILDALIVESLE